MGLNIDAAAVDRTGPGCAKLLERAFKDLAAGLIRDPAFPRLTATGQTGSSARPAVDVSSSADVEQDVRDLVRGHQLARIICASALSMTLERLSDHGIGRVGCGHSSWSCHRPTRYRDGVPAGRSPSRSMTVSDHATANAAPRSLRSRRWSCRTPRRRHRSRQRHRRRARPPLPRRRGQRRRRRPSTASADRRRRAGATPSVIDRRRLHRGRQRRADRAGRAGVRTDRPVLRQRRHRRSAPTSTRPRTTWQHAFDVNVNAHRWAAKHLVAGLAGPRRGLLLLDRVGGRAPDPDRLGAVHAHQAGRRRLRRVARRSRTATGACG